MNSLPLRALPAISCASGAGRRVCERYRETLLGSAIKPPLLVVVMDCQILNNLCMGFVRPNQAQHGYTIIVQPP